MWPVFVLVFVKSKFIEIWNVVFHDLVIMMIEETDLVGFELNGRC